MIVVVRVDASAELGSGHVMRCLTLAHRLTRAGAAVSFICTEVLGALSDFIEARGYAVARIGSAGDASTAVARGVQAWEADAAASRAAIRTSGARPDLLVVDHYGLDARWERLLRPLVGRILVLDDLANRPHDCDLLLDQSLHDDPDGRYANLVDPATRVFVGPSYALLREEFDVVSPSPRDGGLRQLLVFFGGNDSSNEIGKVINALRALGAARPAVTVVLGPQYARTAQIRDATRDLESLEIIAETNEMSRLMATADLGIGTCGGAAWERCAVGLPALVVVTADNQRDDARLLERLGAVRILGDAGAVDTADWCEHIRALERDPAALLAMSRAAAGVLQRRHESMSAFLHALTAGVRA